jgi:hypothetical protein
MSPDPGARFCRLLVFRRRGVPTQVLRVLEDAEGWHYVVNLGGTSDFGPYLPAEIASAFNVEPEPFAVRILQPVPADGTVPCL